jgi:hypothetical protein
VQVHATLIGALNAKPESFYILGYLLPTGLIIKIWQYEIIFSSKSSEFRFFFHEKSFVQVEIIFSRSKVGKVRPPKKKPFMRLKKKGICDKIFCFKEIVSRFGDFSPKRKTVDNFKEAKGLKGRW